VVDIVAITPLLCEAIALPLSIYFQTGMEVSVRMTQLLVSLFSPSELIAVTGR
jgi:hypothetical protein